MEKNHNIACAQLWFVILIAFSLVFFISHDTIDYNSAFTVERNGKLAVFFTSLFDPNPPLLTESPSETNGSDRDVSGDTCSGRYIYVHDLPSRFNDDVIENCSYSLVKWFDMCQSLTNLGLGTQVRDPGKVLVENSWYATNQFTLAVIFRHRMKGYECLTNDSSLASAIFVPFYAGFDIGRHLWGYNTTARDALGVELVSWLKNQPEWTKRGLWGRDHFLISGRIAWDLRRSDDDDSHWGGKLMQLPESMNMTMLSIETTSWSNEFAIPYPTYFHPSAAKQVQQWQKRMKRHKRPYLFSFVGAPRANMTESIRGELINQCLGSRKKCKLLNCHSGSQCDSPVEVMRVFQNSVFCLQPAGDSYTRRSTFDSILAGCIPVFFHPFSAYGQYIWHLPRNYSSYSVYIPEEMVREARVSIRKRLLQVPTAEIASMRQEVIKLIPKVIYRDPRSKLKDFEDAFDIAVKGMLERVGKVSRQIEEGKDPGIGFAEPGSWKLKMDGIGRDHEWDSFL
ncbi:unnamed protein product [Linum tenue]|uniref:Exostosin GT47 domain-containing protein n=1 Tax=Linum tenue TaxID=586396 RepID=A0AAV0LEB2_9ROSI|nr:unnamed protein product [Linum tenue]